LANTLPLIAGELDLTLLGDARRPRPEIAGLEGARYVGLDAPRGAREAWWLQVSAAQWLRRWDGLFHATFIGAPFWPRVPLVLTIADLSYEHHPEDLPWWRRRLFQATCRVSARRALEVITHTEVVKREIVQWYEVDPSIISIFPPHADPVFGSLSASAIEQTLAALGVSRPYVVAIGGANRRGLEVSVAAWEPLASQVGLVVVGPQPPPDRPGITYVGFVPDEQWAALLAGAVAFCYPTRFEGFGMPGLEAAASGTPVVCARLPVLEESLGPAAEWCASPSATDISAGLRRVVSDAARAEELRVLGLKQAAAAPTWESAAATLLEAYRRASRRAAA
jgi:glycosyltransferase involved in cell wall biosynthesis